MAQINSKPAYEHSLVERVTVYLHTRDVRLFPFAASFDADRQKAFMGDLRDALADLQDSGSARKTAASGFIMKDKHLREVIAEWEAANGDWPASHQTPVKIKPAPAR
jgi:hypothetical protein